MTPADDIDTTPLRLPESILDLLNVQNKHPWRLRAYIHQAALGYPIDEFLIGTDSPRTNAEVEEWLRLCGWPRHTLRLRATGTGSKRKSIDVVLPGAPSRSFSEPEVGFMAVFNRVVEFAQTPLGERLVVEAQAQLANAVNQAPAFAARMGASWEAGKAKGAEEERIRQLGLLADARRRIDAELVAPPHNITHEQSATLAQKITQGTS